MIKMRFFIVVILFYNITTLQHVLYASAWLPEQGQYKVISSIALTDNISKKLRHIRYEIYIKLQLSINLMQEMQNQIKAKSKLSDLDKIKVEMLDNRIKHLKSLALNLDSFNEKLFMNLDIEYGLNDNNSIGSKLFYFSEESIKFSRHYHILKSYHNAQKADFYHKYKLFQNQRWIVSLKNTLSFGLQSQIDAKTEMIIGYAKILKKNKRKIFQEFAVSANYELIKFNHEQKPVYSISLLDGITFCNGISFINFTQYSFSKNINIIYNKVLYEQISIAKTFKFKNTKVSNFTASIGYFDKRSLLNHNYKISGPVFSLWFNL